MDTIWLLAGAAFFVGSGVFALILERLREEE
jgi:hypothetical protein